MNRGQFARDTFFDCGLSRGSVDLIFSTIKLVGSYFATGIGTRSPKGVGLGLINGIIFVYKP